LTSIMTFFAWGASFRSLDAPHLRREASISFKRVMPRCLVRINRATLTPRLSLPVFPD
jgi:hypothetical protein